MIAVVVGSAVIGFLVHQLFTWYTREPEQEDLLLIDVACQTSPIKRLDVKNYYKILNQSSSSSEDEIMNIEFCSSDLNF